MRPSKLRLPLSTEQTTRLFSRTTAATSSGNGPLLPMHVVQPYPTRSNPSVLRYGDSPAASRYSVTTFEPGARLLLTHGFRINPRSTAFLATRPAPIITLGFEVFVQLVIAAMTTAPWSSSASAGSKTATPDCATAPVALATPCRAPPASDDFAGFCATCIVGSATWNAALAFLSDTRSCGRLGPARLGSIESRLSSTVLE